MYGFFFATTVVFSFFFVARSYDSPRSSYSSDHGHRGYPDRSKSYNSESMDWQKAAEAWARSKSRDGMKNNIDYLKSTMLCCCRYSKK